MITFKANMVAIELTRRCNMACGHCMRGDPQPIDLDPAYLGPFFRQIDFIDTLVLSGGEPSLVPEIITAVKQALNDACTKVYSLEIVTNGKVVSVPFINALATLDIASTYNLAYGGIYHEEVPKVNIKRLKNNLCPKWTVHPQGIHGKFLSKQGRSKEGTEPDLYSPFLISTLHSTYVTGRPVYLNAEGFIVPHCDLSYENQAKHIMCRADESIFDAVVAFNTRVE